MSSKNGSPRSKRQLQVGEMLKHALSERFMRGDFYDPESNRSPAVTVSEVKVSADLKNATVYVMPLAGKEREETMKTLANISHQIKHSLSGKLRLKYMPNFYFTLDKTFDEASKMDEIFQNIHNLEKGPTTEK